MNRICELLNIEYPIIQGGMARISESGLAAAVSNAGGLGTIAAGNAPVDLIRADIRRAKELTGKPFAVNIMMLSETADDIAALCCEELVPVVITGAGVPSKYMAEFKRLGIKVIPVVPSVAIAKRLEGLGADALIAEGMEAGGHIGQLTSMALVPQIADAVHVPLIGAGGVADGRQMAAMFMLGAEGVQVGTRFLVANECIVHQNYKDKVLRARDIDTVVTGRLTGHPVRGLKNKLTRMFDEAEKEESGKDKPDIKRIEAIGIGALKKSVVDGDVDYGTVMAGQVAGMVTKQQSGKEIIDELVAGCRERLNGGIAL